MQGEEEDQGDVNVQIEQNEPYMDEFFEQVSTAQKVESASRTVTAIIACRSLRISA